MIRNNHQKFTMAVALITSAAFLSACGKTEVASNANQTVAKTVSVTTAKAETRPIAGYLEATGSISADDSSAVAPQVSGQVLTTPVDVGAFVRQGDVLVQLNPRDAQLRLDQARSGEMQALAGLKQAQARVGLSEGGTFDPNNVPEVLAAFQAYEAAQSQVQNALANVENLEAQARLAEDTARRYGNLLKTGDASQLLYNQHRTQAAAARKQVDAAKASVNSLRSQANASKRQYEAAINIAKQSNQGVYSAQASYDNAKTQVAIAEKALADTAIRAPFSGFISERLVAAGEYVTTSSKLVTLVKTNPIRMILQIPETDTAKVSVGVGVSISTAAYPGRQFAGRITAINPSLDQQSRAVSIEASIDNDENLLKPNMFATGRILQSGTVSGVFIPKVAVQSNTSTDSKRVFVIVDGKARIVVVQTGIEEADHIQITSGLDGTETVAVSGFNELFDGVPVAVTAQ